VAVTNHSAEEPGAHHEFEDVSSHVGVAMASTKHSADKPGEHHEVKDHEENTTKDVDVAVAVTNHSAKEPGAHHEFEDVTSVGVAMESSSQIPRPSHNIGTQVRTYILCLSFFMIGGFIAKQQ